MLNPGIALIMFFLRCGIFAQNQDGKEFLTFEGDFDLSTTDTLACEEYSSLKQDLNKFNRNKLNKTWRLADALLHQEFPCYEFEAKFEGKS